jgi:hypothetical protein
LLSSIVRYLFSLDFTPVYLLVACFISLSLV